ncbi:MAG: hypothetical protein NT034_04915, partial [Candidatus Magasanikbacteria bacterium]|nr:hypothetical protein [Candidatus Magasanikbacteria bacterium]
TGGEFYCPVCHIKNLDGKNCRDCQAASQLIAVAAFFNYQNNKVVSELIKRFKYSLATDINQLWLRVTADFLNTIWSKSGWPTSDIVIIPVPLHRRRYRERGFNQAQLIAQNIFEILKKYHPGVQLDDINLQRIKFTKQQARLNRAERLSNIKGAFVYQGQNLSSKNIILVDDVFTSGSTMQECALILKSAGALQVYGLVMARD